MCTTARSTTTVQVVRVDLRIRFPRVESRERSFFKTEQMARLIDSPMKGPLRMSQKHYS